MVSTVGDSTAERRVSEPVEHIESTRRGRWRHLPLLAAAAILPAALSLAPRPAAAATSTISLVRAAPCASACLGFVPGALSVATGDRVTWTDPALVPCTLRPTSGPDSAFTGGALPGYSYTLTIPGLYAFRCAEHPEVHATLGVVGPVTPARAVAATTPKTAAVDPLLVVPVVTDHTPGYVPVLISAGGVVLALTVSQLGARLRWV